MLSPNQKVGIGVGAVAVTSLAALLALGRFRSVNTSEDPVGPVLGQAVNAPQPAAGGNPDIPTYVLDYRTNTTCYPFTTLNIEQHLVPGSAGGHKNYGHFGVDVTHPITINLGTKNAATGNVLNTNNIYWNVTGMSGSPRYASVGGDVRIGSDGHVEFDQFTGLQRANPSLSPRARCVSQPGSTPSCFVDSGGEQRNSVYMIVTNPSRSQGYSVTGGILFTPPNGVLSVGFTINPASRMDPANRYQCQCPALAFPATQEIDWAVMSPPPNNTTPGNYRAYATVGGNFQRAGTNALVFNQFINPSIQFPSGVT